MCGFSGFVAKSGEVLPCERRQNLLRSMGRALAHRGPDDETYYHDNYLSLVFRRLSIIDVDGGAQPIWNEDRTKFVAVNGEIYNYRDLRRRLESKHQFSTHSDAEVVLHLFEEYGTTAFSMLNGMFAIVLWDSVRNVLILARDRMGIKPLYYTESNGNVLFGSELKALLMHPQCPRELAWADLASAGLSQKSQIPSYIKGVHHFPAGGYGTWIPGNPLVLDRYWTADALSASEDRSRSVSYYVDEYEALLVDSVQRQLMSDVPIGLFLSGGIDSSLIAAIAANAGTEFHCFSFAEENTFASGDLPDAINVAQELGLPQHSVFFNLESLLSDLAFNLSTFEQFVWMMDSPRFDLEFLFKHEIHRFVKTNYADVKVLLLGQGADEFTGGYSGLAEGHYRDWDDYLMRSVAPGVRSNYTAERSIPTRFESLLQNLDRAGVAGFADYRQRMLDYYSQMQHFNLWHEDRTSSAQGREARVPFLDHRLVEFSFGIPQAMHAQLFWNKNIIRSVLSRQLPSYSIKKKKIPFFVTETRRSIQTFAVKIIERIYPEFREKYGADTIFDVDALDRLIARAQRSAGADEQAVWMVIEAICVQIFIRQISSPADAVSEQYEQASPLLELTVDQKAQLATVFTDQNPKSEFSFVPGLRFASPLPAESGTTQFFVIENDRVLGKLKLKGDHHWVSQWLSTPDCMTKTWSLESVARTMAVKPTDVTSVLDGLWERGYVH